MSTPNERLAQVSGHLAPVPKIAPSSLGPRLQGKVAIITGCNSTLGIGRATAEQYAQHGLRALYICDYDASNLPSLQASLATANPTTEIHWKQFDASDDAKVKEVVDEAVRKYGRLDIFFANAGVVGSGRNLHGIEADGFLRTLKINTISAFVAVKHASKAMMITSKEKPTSGGSIIATASVAGIRSGAGPVDYSASKAAVINLMQTSAYQLAGTGIRCNALCPGLIETGMTAPVYSMARARGTEGKIGQVNPMKRGGVADEIARVALFLGSDEGSYVNAQAWAVDGGLSGSHPTVLGKTN